MSFGVFIHRADTIYDDRPAERYQFPSQYLRRVETCLHDWIIYYEPRKLAKSRGYFGVAKVDRVIADTAAPGMYLALMERGSYIDFATPVPFRGSDGVIERGLLNEAGRISGRAQSAVRQISAADFNNILQLGLSDDVISLPRAEPPTMPPGFREEQSAFLYDERRNRVEYLGSRVFRDNIFRRVVLTAYNSRCAVTGLKLINGGGRAEVEAAHIQPVGADGPDIVTNGIALSGTVHWMFDRGLISLTDNLQILFSRQINDAEAVRTIINSSGYIFHPERWSDRPNPHFLSWHRTNCFKA